MQLNIVLNKLNINLDKEIKALTFITHSGNGGCYVEEEYYVKPYSLLDIKYLHQKLNDGIYYIIKSEDTKRYSLNTCYEQFDLAEFINRDITYSKGEIELYIFKINDGNFYDIKSEVMEYGFCKDFK